MFSDLQRFSTHAEQLAPDALLEQMSVYFEQVSRAISDENGTVDKFIGDGVMAFWGAGRAARPRAARVRRRVEGGPAHGSRQSSLAGGRQAGAVAFAIGLNTADVLVGNVGSSRRFSYTAMGDGVNVASRLEAVNKSFGTTICISDSVYDAVAAEVVARPLRRVQVKGRKQEFMVYELLGMQRIDDPELAIRPGHAALSKMTWAASRCFEKGDFIEAARRYRQVSTAFPDDPVARAMAAACSLSLGVPAIELVANISGEPKV